MRRSDALALLFLAACSRSPTPSARARPEPGAPTNVAARTPIAPALTYVERVTGGADAHARLPTIVAIHGLGDRPEQFLALFDALPSGARVIAPRAPHVWGDGFAWMTTRVRDGREDALDAEIEQCTRALVALLEALVARDDVASPVVVTGFSQGGILTYAVTIARPDLVRVALPVAGLLPSGDVAELPRAPTNAPEIIAFHGDADVVVPYARDAALVESLRATGWPARLETYPGVRHVIPEPMRTSLHGALVHALTPID